MNLSQHFTLDEATFSETAVRKGIDNTPSATVIANMVKASAGMEMVRDVLRAPVHISSWFRCLLLNRAVGSSDTSGHRQGWSIDFKAPKFGTPKEICEAIVRAGIKFDQLIYEGTWVHISFDPAMRGQVLTAVFKPGKKTVYLTGIN